MPSLVGSTPARFRQPASARGSRSSSQADAVRQADRPDAGYQLNLLMAFGGSPGSVMVPSALLVKVTTTVPALPLGVAGI